MSTSQKNWVLSQLKRGKKVTPIDALNGCGCFRLAAVIFNLREEGHMVLTTKVKNGKGAAYASYSLPRGKK